MSGIPTPLELWAKVVLQNKLLTPQRWAEALALREEMGSQGPIGQLLIDNGYLREEIVRAVDKKVNAVHEKLLAAPPAPSPAPPAAPKRKSNIQSIDLEPQAAPGVDPVIAQPSAPALDDPNQAPGISGGQTALGASLSVGHARRDNRHSKPLQIPVDGDEVLPGEKSITEEDLMPKSDADHWNPSDADWIDDVSVHTKARVEHTQVEQIDLVEDDPAKQDPTGRPKILRQDDAAWANNASPAIVEKKSSDILQIDMDAPPQTEDPMVPKPTKKIIHRDGPAFK